MKESSYRVIIWLGLFCNVQTLCVPEAIGNMRDNPMISNTQILHRLPKDERHEYLSNAKVFVDADNRIIVSCSSSVLTNDDAIKLLVFVLNNGQWVNSTNVLSGRPYWSGMIHNGEFQAYAISTPQAKENRRLKKISIYGLTANDELSSDPFETIEMDGNKKVFEKEISRYVRQLLPLTDSGKKFFLIGEYTESILNVLTLIGRIISGGHSGSVDRPFSGIIENGEITDYCNIPGKHKDNEYSTSLDAVVRGDEVHAIWLKGQNYSDTPRVLQHSKFVLPDKGWAEPVEIFKEHRRKKNTVLYFSDPFLAFDSNNIYCVWSWRIYDQVSEVFTKESGVYFCNFADNQWSKPIKLVGSDSGAQPKIIVDNKGEIHVFWTEKGKGLFCKSGSAVGWNDKRLLIKDARIRSKDRGLTSSPTQSLSIAVDHKDNLHIAYIREGYWEDDSINRTFVPEELVYFNITQIRH